MISFVARSIQPQNNVLYYLPKQILQIQCQMMFEELQMKYLKIFIQMVLPIQKLEQHLKKVRISINYNIVFLNIFLIFYRKSCQFLLKLQYLKAISDAINKAKFEIKLIVAIDRAKGIDEAEKTLNLVKKNKIQHLVGVDLCGHPGIGHFSQYKSILQKFRDLGYKITVHTGELKQQIEENNDVIDFQPDRIGHFIYFTEEQLNKIKNLNILIEVCFSSNLFTTNMHPDCHPVKQFISQGIPIAICTDDTLCFNTTVTKEIELIKTTFGYSNEFISSILKQSLNYKFKLE